MEKSTINNVFPVRYFSLVSSTSNAKKYVSFSIGGSKGLLSLIALFAVFLPTA